MAASLSEQKARDDGGGEWQTFNTTQASLAPEVDGGSTMLGVAGQRVALPMLCATAIPGQPHVELGVCVRALCRGAMQKALLRAFDEGARTKFMDTWQARIPDTVFRVGCPSAC